MVQFVPVVKLLLLLLLSHYSVCGRIGSFIRPIHYDLVFLPMIDPDFNRLCGHVFIDIEPNATTNQVILNQYEVYVLDVSIQLVGESKHETSFEEIERLQKVEDLCFTGHFKKESDDVDSIKNNDTTQQLSVIFKKPIVPKRKYRIGLFYIGKIMENIEGFFRSNLQNENSSHRDSR